MGSPVQWLGKELPLWVEEGIITEDEGRLLRERYERTEEGSLSWFAAVPVVSFAAGIVLLAAGYWTTLPQDSRFWLAMAPLFLSFLLLAFYLFRREEASSLLRESAGIFHGLSLSAAVWLIHDSYYLTNDLFSLALWTAVFLLPALYLTRSAGLGILYTAAAALGAGLAPYRGWPDGAAWLLLLGALPYLFLLLRAHREKSILLIAWTWAAGIFYVTYCTMDSPMWQILFFSVIASFTWMGGALLPVWDKLDAVFRFFGCMSVFAVLVKASFGTSWAAAVHSWFLWIILLLFLLAAVPMVSRVLRKKEYLSALSGMTPFALALSAALSAWDRTGAASAMVSTVFFALLSLALFFQGHERRDGVQETMGILFLLLAAGLRVADSSLSYMARGSFFLGAALFLGALYAVFAHPFSRKKEVLPDSLEEGEEEKEDEVSRHE